MKKPLYYTFGNHKHWVDFHWLWGYEVLPASIRDMLALIDETGARGNVNFDAVGYEKLAAEDPEVLDELRAAVREGKVEIVGASYAQPYGLFQGGESNVRQRVYGVRTVLRLFGVRPRSFWEEEFDFFPQLPQVLRGCGFTGASLFFQWTWHTPTVPEERLALVQWEGLDGTRLPATPKNELCLHQWPEDFDGRLDSELVRELDTPAIVQWVELLPSPDWMCRSEVLLPRLKELFADERFELRPATLSELIEALDRGDAPVRRYTLDDVFHGMSLGKNGDYMPRFSKACEEQILAAESISALAGLFGRPYASWDVYPTWELEEAWRDLFVAQHHDNHECEALCGFVGERSFERSLGLSESVFSRTLKHLARRVEALDGSVLVYNPLGWTRDVPFEGGVAAQVPPFGYRVVDPYEDGGPPLGDVVLRIEGGTATLSRGSLQIAVDLGTGLLTGARSPDFPEGMIHPQRPLGELAMTVGSKPERFETVEFDPELQVEGEHRELVLRREGRSGGRILVTYGLSQVHDAFFMRIFCEDLPRPDGGMHTGLQTSIAPDLENLRLLHDHPYGISPVRADRDHVRKYPTGHWMTSPQVFEDIHRPFTALTLVDLSAGDDPDRGLLLVHDGGQAFFRDEQGIRALVTMYDPWDEDHWDGTLEATWWFVPHGRWSRARMMRTAMECNLGEPHFSLATDVQGGGDLPPEFGGAFVDCPGVLATAFHRESRYAAKNLPDYFSGDSATGIRDPYVVRLVEYEGEPAELTLRIPGPAASAARTNPMGEVIERLDPFPVESPFPGTALAWSGVRLSMRPHEIVTVMLDLEAGRQIPRDLDRYRHVWATVHRQGSPSSESEPRASTER